MVGEIRDYETAEHAIHAALTGHLVLSTLHTNDAPSAIARLTDLGVPAYLVESTLIGVMAQRLVRKICHHCQQGYFPSTEELAALRLTAKPEARIEFVRGAGCVQCRGTGYFGRTGIYEMMAIDDDLRRLIHQQASAIDFQQTARKAGMQTLRDSALRKLHEGVTTSEEVLRLTNAA